jgi:hypothetical protein
MWSVSMTGSAPKVHIAIHRLALEAIFDECDRYDHHETGGRLIGSYRAGGRGRLLITVSGVIESSAHSKRSATSFFQDGEYQEKIFRSLEAKYTELEHLGNWHTHHVNGYPTLSNGDCETYHRIVNHSKHNSNFFYALLVTERNTAGSKDRYAVKHFILFRDDPSVYEVPATYVRVVDRPAIWPVPDSPRTEGAPQNAAANAERGRDSQFIEEWYPALRPYLSKDKTTVYWRGRIMFIDDSAAEVVVAEVEDGRRPAYGVAVKGEPASSTNAARRLSEKHFRSAREAIMTLHGEINSEMFKKLQNN